MKKTLSIGMSMTLFVSACAPQKEIVRDTSNSTPTAVVERAADANLIELWQKLHVSSYRNPGVAELIKSVMSKPTQDQLRSGTLPADVTFLKELARSQDTLKRHLILGNVPYSFDQQIISGTAMFAADRLAISSERFVKGLDQAREIEIQNRALKTIQDTFENRAEEIARLFAPSVVQKMSPEEINTVTALTGTLEEKARQILPILKKYDRILASYEFTPDDQVKLVFWSMVASVIAKEVTEHKSLQHLLKQVQEISKAVTLLKEAHALIQLMNEQRKDALDSLYEMRDAIVGIKNDIDQARKKIDPRLSADGNAKAKRLLSDLVFGRTKESAEPGPFAQPLPISPNVLKLADAAKTASENMRNILKAANDISAKFGLKVDPGLAKALDTATKVAAGVSLAQNVLVGAASGGVIGALGAFASSGGLGALGLGGGDPMAADIKAIKEQLNHIAEMQQKMMEMQVETMKMIQSLAELIQSYHFEQMYVLREIRKSTEVNTEISRVLANEDLRACHSMLEFILGGSMNLENSVDFLSIPRSLIYAQVNDRKKLEHFIKSTTESNFASCQKGISNAFASSSLEHSPLIAAMNTQETVLGPYATENFRPLVRLWKRVSFNPAAFGVHLPSLNATSLASKLQYARATVSQDAHIDVDRLVSTEALERYISVLLLMGPVTSFDKKDWDIFLQTNDLPHQDLSWNRSNRLLRGALIKVQTALAQESLIAGEPLLFDLSQQFASLLSQRTTHCESFPSGDEKRDLACAIKGNTLLRKNLLTYILHQRLGSSFFDRAYEQALANNDALGMQNLIGREFSGFVVPLQKDGKTVLGLNWNYESRANSALIDPLPDVKTVREGKIAYSENVTRLLSLQQKLVEAIVEITPTLLSSQTQKDILSILAVK